MKTPKQLKTVLAAVLAAGVIGCAPSTTPTNGGTADKPKDDGTKVSQNAPTNSALAPDTVGGATSTTKTTTTTTTTTQGATGAPVQGGAAEPPTAGGGQRGGRGFGLGFMVNNVQFKKELNITPEQVKKIEAILPQRPQGGAPGGGQAATTGGAAAGGQQMTPEERQKQRDELETKIKAILTTQQKARIQEIQYQMMGARAFTNPDVVKLLGITADQTKKFEALTPPRGGQGGAPGGGAPGSGQAAPPAGGGQQMTPEERAKQREETMTKALAILTPAQKARWAKITGKPFKFVMPQRPAGGGGGNSMVPK